MIDAPLSTPSAAATSGRSSATSGRLIPGDIVWVGLLIEGPYHADADADADAYADAYAYAEPTPLAEGETRADLKARRKAENIKLLGDGLVAALSRAPARQA